MCIAICVVGDSIRSMEAPSAGCPAKEPSRNFLRRKTNIFVAMPTLLTLYFIGAGIAFVLCTRTFVSFHIYSHASQAPVQVFRVNSTFFSGQATVLVPEKGALEVLEELQALPHALRDERGVDVFKADTYNASWSQPDFDLEGDEQVAVEADTAANEVAFEGNTAMNDVAVEADNETNEVAVESHIAANEVAIEGITAANDVAVESHIAANEVAVEADTGTNEVAFKGNIAMNDVAVEAVTVTNEVAVESHIAANEVAVEEDTGTNDEEYDIEPEFMQTPTIKKNKQVHAAILQHRLKRMSSWERRRWLRQNWSIFKILKKDKISDQFNDRMREFFCTYNHTPHLHNSLSRNSPDSSPPETLKTKTLHETDETNICHAPTTAGGSEIRDTHSAFCTQRFFLTWMSPVASFSPRERLGLESIFKHHPRACVVILSRTMDSDEGRKILSPFLTRGYRVLAVTPDLSSLFATLPAAKWLRRLRDGTGDPGSINLMQNLSNIMRLAALHKYGGVYLDTDVIVLQSFAALRNVVGTQSRNTATGRWTRLNNAVLVFDRAHPVVLEFLREFVVTFDGSRWGWNGPYLVSRVVNRVLQVQRWANCSDVAILDMQAFYPVNWIDIVKFFQRPTAEREIKWQERELQWMNQGTYSIHLWNKRSNHLRVEKGSIMETLFKRSCLFCKQVAEL